LKKKKIKIESPQLRALRELREKEYKQMVTKMGEATDKGRNRKVEGTTNLKK
jgi:hypothetical protein